MEAGNGQKKTFLQPLGNFVQHGNVKIIILCRDKPVSQSVSQPKAWLYSIHIGSFLNLQISVSSQYTGISK